jgi:hypothetical protein
MKKYQSNVVADEFKYGSDRNVVVALEHNVLMVNKKDMLKVSCMRLESSSWRLTDILTTAHTSIALNAYEEAPITE